MSDFKDRMIEAYERGECSYEGSYDYVRESMADQADRRRKAERENSSPSVRAVCPKVGYAAGAFNVKVGCHLVAGHEGPCAFGMRNR